LVSVRRNVRREFGLGSTECTEGLDWCEIAVEVCREKKRSGQALRNPAGLLVKILKDVNARRRFVNEEAEARWKQSFRQREEALLRRRQQEEERALILEYERFRQDLAQSVYRELPDDKRAALVREKLEVLSQHDRFQRMPREAREQEAEDLVLQDLAKKEAPAFEKWLLRRKAAQIVLPFATNSELAAEVA